MKVGNRYLRLALASLWLAACADPIVGGECKPGLRLCDGRCVDILSDFRHCGMCDNSCGRFLCQAGRCTSDVRPDAGPVTLPDGRVLDGSVEAGLDAGVDAMPARDAKLPDDAGSGCGLGLQLCGAGCVNTNTDREHCGDCDNACTGSQLCALGRCADGCEDPLIRCAGACVDPNVDPAHCGDCGRRCSSGLCVEGACADAVPGQVVVLGHDYSARVNDVMRRLIGNAVFLAGGAPVRTLVYTGDASGSSVAGVEAAIDAISSADGREWERVEALDGLVPFQLGSSDAFVIHAQHGATNSVLDKLAKDWANALIGFLKRGGVVVLIEAQSDRNDGTHQILEPPGVFVAVGRESISEQTLNVPQSGLGVGKRVPAAYRGEEPVVRFEGVESFGSAVVVDQDGETVVFHRIVPQ